MQLFDRVNKIIRESGILEKVRVESDDSTIVLLSNSSDTMIRLTAEKKFGKIGGKETGHRFRCVTSVCGNNSYAVEDTPSILCVFKNFCTRLNDIEQFYDRCSKILPELQMKRYKNDLSVGFDISNDTVLTVCMSLHVKETLFSCETSIYLTKLGAESNRIMITYHDGNDLVGTILKTVKVTDRRMNNIRVAMNGNCERLKYLKVVEEI